MTLLWRFGFAIVVIGLVVGCMASDCDHAARLRVAVPSLRAFTASWWQDNAGAGV